MGKDVALRTLAAPNEDPSSTQTLQGYIYQTRRASPSPVVPIRLVVRIAVTVVFSVSDSPALANIYSYYIALKDQKPKTKLRSDGSDTEGARVASNRMAGGEAAGDTFFSHCLGTRGQ